MKTKINNKNGFVLAETLVVIIFVLIIFTVLYNSAVPLLGRYDELSYYDDLDTTYDVYQYKKLFESDSNYSNIANNHYKKLTCSDIIDNTNKCSQLNNYLNVVNQDTLLYFNSDYLEEIKNDESISYEIKDYLDYLKLESDINILLLEHEGYISYIELAAIVDSNYIKKEIIKKDEVCKTYVEEDGIMYISGTKECIDFNYVWWSGKMWRITAIYQDGAMKLITDNNITSIAFNALEQVSYYVKADEANGIAEVKSYMFQFLNEDFLDTLYNQGEDVIDKTKYWNATMPDNTTISTKPEKTEVTMISTTTSPVGLLNSYEYYKSYQNVSDSNGYLNIGYVWWLLNPRGAVEEWVVGSSGNGNYGGSQSRPYGVRPSIYIKSGILLSGSGTKKNPYRLSYDYDDANANDKINTRYSGEYVKLKNNESEQLFRIVNIENNKTKIVAMDYADNKATRIFATSNSDTLWGSGTAGIDTWYTFLNGTYYPNLVSTYGEIFDSNLYYLGTSGSNYKLSVCANTTSGNTKVCDKTSQTGTFDIGLLRYGEMFATAQENGYSNSISMWLINRYNESNGWWINNDGVGYINVPTHADGARPTVHLKSDVKILSGSGTELDPFVVGL